VRTATLWKYLALILGGYGLLCLLVLAFQRRLMYFPDRAREPEALRVARGSGLQPWRDSAGSLIGWRAQRPAASSRVLVLHGNAGSGLDRGYYLPLLGTPANEVILFEYPGYGPRPGQPSEAVLVAAAEQALLQLKTEAPGPIWLLGESLGSGVACAVAARRPADIAGLILVTPFARMTEVAAWHYPYLPVRLLLRDRWDNLAALRSFAGEVLLVLAGQDEVVGVHQGRKLAEGLGSRARTRCQEQAGHNSLDLRPGAAPWPEIRAWMSPDGEGPPRP
jgi:hypothetical protein